MFKCSRLMRPRMIIDSSTAFAKEIRSLSGSSLNFTKYGTKDSHCAPVLFLHGVFGSKINFNKPARRIAAELNTESYCVDCRNHGGSPWHETMYLAELAQDVVTFVEEHSLDRVNIVGHSLGGKQACLVCSHHPHLVKSAVIVDNFPVKFFSALLDETCTALSLLDLNTLTSREEAFKLLANQIKSEAERGFLLSNLERVKGGGGGVKTGGWRWRCNLDVISQFTEEIRGYPHSTPPSQTRTLFLYGGDSGYMTLERVERTKELFSAAEFQGIGGAGHIVHLDQPEIFYTALRDFLKKHGCV